MPSPLFTNEILSARKHAGGAAPPSVNLGPSYISETARATKVTFYTVLDIVLFSGMNFLTIRRVGGAAPHSVNLRPQSSSSSSSMNFLCAYYSLSIGALHESDKTLTSA